MFSSSVSKTLNTIYWSMQVTYCLLLSRHRRLLSPIRGALCSPCLVFNLITPTLKGHIAAHQKTFVNAQRKKKCSFTAQDCDAFLRVNQSVLNAAVYTSHSAKSPDDPKICIILCCTGAYSASHKTLSLKCSAAS